MGQNHTAIQIRRARPEEADVLSRIARSAKAHWNYPESWLARWKGALTITSEFISINQVYCAVIEEQVVGFYGMIVSDGQAILDHLWINPEHIGGGIGRRLFSHAAEIARSLRAKVIEIESDPHAEEFYKRMGAIRVGEVPADIDGVSRVLPLLEFVIDN